MQNAMFGKQLMPYISILKPHSGNIVLWSCSSLEETLSWSDKDGENTGEIHGRRTPTLNTQPQLE